MELFVFLLQVSNIIYLDSPAGVGLSYSKNKSDYTTGDVQTALDSHKFLLEVIGFVSCFESVYDLVLRLLKQNLLMCFAFFIHNGQWFKLFPQFLPNPFFIAGESYAGVYVPTLATQVVKGISLIGFTYFLLQN